MDAGRRDETSIPAIAAAIGDRARARMLYCLMDGHARTGTELAAVAGVSASTASVHLARLCAERLVAVLAQGRYRYYTLASTDVANVLEALSALAGDGHAEYVPSTPAPLRAARTCYDHLAGAVAVSLHAFLVRSDWIRLTDADAPRDYELGRAGAAGFAALGIDLAAAQATRRRFAFGCLDWSERRLHLGGALGACVLDLMRRRRWVGQPDGSRALRITALGRRELRAHFDIDADAPEARAGTHAPRRGP